MQASEQKLHIIQMLLLLNNQKYLKQIESILIEAIQMEESLSVEKEANWEIGLDYNDYITKTNFKEWIQDCEEGELIPKETFIQDFLQWKNIFVKEEFVV